MGAAGFAGRLSWIARPSADNVAIKPAEWLTPRPLPPSATRAALAPRSAHACGSRAACRCCPEDSALEGRHTCDAEGPRLYTTAATHASASASTSTRACQAAEFGAALPPPLDQQAHAVSPTLTGGRTPRMVR